MRVIVKLRWIICLLLIIGGLTLNLRSSNAVAAQTREGESARVTTLDDLFAEVARRVPAFGGLFIGPDKTLQMYLLDPAQKAAAEEAIFAVFGRERFPEGEIRVLQGQYGFLQLKAWHDRQRVVTLAIPGVVRTSIAESKNQLKIGVSDLDVISQVERELANLGIPREAVDIVQAKPIELYQDLTDTRRPLVGGLQVLPSTKPGGGTLGFLAVRSGQAGFVTASHCTNIQGGVEDTIFHQAFPAGDTNRIGVETVDPLFSSFPGCPSGRKCRMSDTAFISRDSGPSQATAPASAELGYIAATDYNSLTITGKFHITGEVSYPLEGEVLSKVGLKTGLTEGEVSDTCVDAIANLNGLDVGNTLLCQDLVEAKAGKGDSGSPVFSWSSATLPPGGIPPAKLYGILWGGDGEVFAFSAMANIQGNGEMGPLKTFLEEAGANSAPEIKIMKPASGTTVGVGGFNAVKFEAEVVDYEGCCTEVTWQSNLDGVIGQGTSIEYTFNTPGTRTVWVTAKDNDGEPAFDSIAVTANNSAPVVKIVKPTSGQTLYVGTTYVFEGDSSDMNEPFFKLPCNALKWTSSNAGDPFPKWGCAPQVTLSTIGWRTITLQGTDSEGEPSNKATVTVNVVNAPANSPPVVTILNPLNNYFLDAYTWVTLKGKPDDPDNKSPITYKWVLKDGATQTVLGQGVMNDGQVTSMQWKPSNNVPFDCGGHTVRIYLYATDADGLQSSAYVDVYIFYPVC
jgi:hypothetical protein